MYRLLLDLHNIGAGVSLLMANPVQQPVRLSTKTAVAAAEVDED
jgi:hypothetical protein